MSPTGNDTNDCLSWATSCLTIQGAINKASAGDTVNVAGGTYDEQVIIGKSLTIQGAGDTTIIQPSGTSILTSLYTLGTQAGAFWNGHKLASIISVQNVGTAGVTVKDLKVDGVNVNSLPGGANYVVGISYGETAGTIDHVTVVNMNSVPVATRTYGMWLDAVGTSVSVEVKNSRISYYNKNGITARGAKLTVDIDTNAIVGPGTIGPDQVPNGLFLTFGTGGTVEHNEVSNNHYTGTEWSSAGIGGYRAEDGVVYEYNDVHDNDMGISGDSGSPIKYNDIHHNRVGINIEEVLAGLPAADNDISYNLIHDNDYGIRILEDGLGLGNAASHNNIYGNTEGVRNWDTTQVFKAENNWYGSASGPTHGSNPGGTGDAASDNVDFAPWLGFLYGANILVWSDETNGVSINKATLRFFLVFEDGGSFKTCSGFGAYTIGGRVTIMGRCTEDPRDTISASGRAGGFLRVTLTDCVRGPPRGYIVTYRFLLLWAAPPP